MESQPDEACTTNESLAASDVAVGGSVDGRKNNSDISPIVVVAAPASGETPKQNDDPASNNIIAVQPRKHTHFRKRALSTAGTVGSAAMGGMMFDNAESLGAMSTSGMSLLNNSLNPNNMMAGSSGGEGEGSIVSFGLNFNFDSTSSHSNSDSGEGDKGDGKEGSEEENKGASASAGEKKKKEGGSDGKPAARPSPKKTSKGSGSGSGSNNKKKEKQDGSHPQAANSNSKENSETASDSGQDQDYNSGGSAASGSGNDGSSGGKSTISSLTTSSNQEWMASQNKEAKGAEAGQGNVQNKKSEGDGNLPKAVTKDGAASNGKKRKKASQGKGGAEGVNDEDSTGGYNTDEEQWGGKLNNKNDGGVGNSIVHKQHHVVTTTMGNSDPSSLTDSNIARDKGGGPPLKQARFSIDQTPHPRAVPSAETSAQMALSSLSSDTPIPTASINGRVPLPSSTSAAQISSSNPSAQATPAAATSQKPRAKRGASGKHHSATLDPKKREERNAREKERSCRIAKQIDELRSLLSRGGVIVAKGTKSSVLAEAANYINLLQQQQVQWEMDRQNMLQQMQEFGMNPPVAPSMQPIEANSMMAGQQQTMVSTVPSTEPHLQNMNAFNTVEPNDYKFIFNNSSVGMAIASMGGAYVDCNDNFCKLSGYSKEEVCSMTIFNMTSRNDLQHAFDLISQMITPNLESPTQNQNEESKSIILQGAMKNRNDLGLSISLIKGSQGIGRCFCVTLVRIISMDKSRPDVISVEMELPVIPNKNNDIGFGASPAYTSG